jgi:two-component system chemotaxis family response regulator WspR
MKREWTVDADDTERLGPHTARRMRVLLVDDQPIIVEAVRQMLADTPELDFFACIDPNEALTTAQQCAPTVILQDLMMDETDGLDLVDAYRTDPLLVNVPVVVLSANEEASIKVQAFARGANDYVVKLPSALELVARVRYHSRAYLDAREWTQAYEALQASQRALEVANRELRESAITDPLTGLRNRRHFRQWTESVGERWLDLEQHQPRQDGPDLIFSVLDVDHFKLVNDQHGHDGGDAVLVEVARRLKGVMRASDELVRWGGEEFLLVSVGVDRVHAPAIIERVLHALGNTPATLPSGQPVRVTVSIGWAPYPFDPAAPRDISIERCLALADAAVYLSKRGGRNRGHGIQRGSGSWDVQVVSAGDDAPERLRQADGGALSISQQRGPEQVCTQ